MSGPAPGRVVKGDVRPTVFGQRVFAKGIGLKFCEEQVLHTELCENVAAEVSVSI
jgi:hypothetical protein